MTKKVLFLLPLFLLLLSSTAQHVINAVNQSSSASSLNLPIALRKENCPVLLPTPWTTSIRIKGGQRLPRSRSYMVSLHRADGIRTTSFTCTGSLLSPTWVLTAAHCKMVIGDIARIGGLTRATGDKHKVIKFISHPDYIQGRDDSLSTGEGDIALLRISPPAKGPFVRVASEPKIPIGDSIARAQGFGTNDAEAADSDVITSGPLAFVDIPVFSPNSCRDAFPISRQVDRSVCASYINSNTCSPCFGDSGGPLLQFDIQQRPVVVGVVSGGRGCGLINAPGIYTRVGSYYDWILEQGVVMDDVSVGEIKIVAVQGEVTTTQPGIIQTPNDNTQKADDDSDGSAFTTSSSSKITNVPLIVGMTVLSGVVALAVVISLMYCWYGNRQRRADAVPDAQDDAVSLDLENQTSGQNPPQTPGNPGGGYGANLPPAIAPISPGSVASPPPTSPGSPNHQAGMYALQPVSPTAPTASNVGNPSSPPHPISMYPLQPNTPTAPNFQTPQASVDSPPHLVSMYPLQASNPTAPSGLPDEQPRQVQPVRIPSAEEFMDYTENGDQRSSITGGEPNSSRNNKS